jgi:hypothetical protein
MTFLDRKGFGASPDLLADAEHDARTRHVAGLVGRDAGVLSAAVDWTDRLDRISDQGATSSCVGQAMSTAIYLAGQAQDRPVPRPSAAWSYALARYYDTPGVLVDVGCRPRSCVLAALQHGIVAESRVPFDAAAVNAAPPLDADVAGADALFTGYYRVAGDVPLLMRMALARGHVPMLSMVVHEAFQDLPGDAVYSEPAGTELGRHMVCVAGYRPGAFRVINSWGTGWADDGTCWIADRFIASSYVQDAYVVNAAPVSR